MLPLQETMKLSKYQMMKDLLNYFGKQDRPILRPNVFGLAEQKGNLESFLNREFTVEERALADLALRDLQTQGLIQPVYRDSMSYGADLVISDMGKSALKTGCLDHLDELLLALGSSYDLISMRYGAHEAALSKRTDWERQASASLVELITKTLHTIAPDQDIKMQEGFKPEKNLTNGITREMRVRFFLNKKHGPQFSKSTEKIVRKSYELL